MPKETTRTGIVFRFVRQGEARPVSMAEFRDFWKVCDENERIAFAKEASEALGVPMPE